MVGQQIQIASVNVKTSHIIIDVTNSLPRNGRPRQRVERSDISRNFIAYSVRNNPPRVRHTGPGNHEWNVRGFDVYVGSAHAKDQLVIVRFGAENVQVGAAVEFAIGGCRT